MTTTKTKPSLKESFSSPRVQAVFGGDFVARYAHHDIRVDGNHLLPEIQLTAQFIQASVMNPDGKECAELRKQMEKNFGAKATEGVFDAFRSQINRSYYLSSIAYDEGKREATGGIQGNPANLKSIGSAEKRLPLYVNSVAAQVWTALQDRPLIDAH